MTSSERASIHRWRCFFCATGGPDLIIAGVDKAPERGDRAAPKEFQETRPCIGRSHGNPRPSRTTFGLES